VGAVSAWKCAWHGVVNSDRFLVGDSLVGIYCEGWWLDHVLVVTVFWCTLMLSDNCIFNIPTKCTYTIICRHFYQHTPTCFCAYCAIFRENFIVCSKLLLCCLITDRKLFCTNPCIKQFWLHKLFYTNPCIKQLSWQILSCFVQTYV
jgi:hypothetical protein